MITVLVVDDHDIVRAGLRQIVSETQDIVVGSEAGTAAEAVDQATAGRFDVIVLDLNLPDRSGLDLLPQLRAIAPDMPVLILSMQQQVSYATRALKSGAHGYVGKESAREHLVTAIRKVARGERFLTPEVAEGLAFDLIEPAGGGTHHGLSAREFQVLCRIAAGKPPREIAAELNVSVKTVATHRARLLAKMGLRNNAGIVQYAIAHDLLPGKL